MKLLFLLSQILALLLLTNLAFGQDKIICAEYQAKIVEEEGLFKTNDNLKFMLEKATTEIGKFNFKLLIDSKTKNTLFFKEENNSLDNSMLERTILVFAKYMGKIYTLENTTFTETKLLGNNIYVKDKPNYNWKIEHETKKIDNFLCYKATGIYKVSHGEKTFHHPITAWFCPQIPYKSGPIGYDGLNGLILELQVRNVVYGLRKINFESNEKLDLSETKKFKMLTPEEYEKKLRELNEQF